MIQNFEDYTFELNKYEKESLLPQIVLGLNLRVGKRNAVTNKQAISWLKQKGFKITPARFRKIIQYIRMTGMINNLLACKKGYYISHDSNEREKYINSLHERLNALNNTLKALEWQHKNTKTC